MKNIFYSILFTSLTFASCNGKAQEKTTTKTEVTSNHKVVSASEFKKAFLKEKQPQLIDVRTPDEFANGTIAGATNSNLLDGTFEKSIADLDKNKTVYVFCAVGGRSGKAAAILKSKGFTSVLDLKGGYNNWPKK